jgi:hypothetical protein
MGKDIALLLAGVIIGFVLDILLSLFLSLDQFRGYTDKRVKKTAIATQEIVKSEKRSELRNRYRYSLGVIIDKLDQIWKRDDFKFKEDAWPCLVHSADADGQPCIANREGKPDPEADRWDLFNLYVRPVIEDVCNFSFIGKYGLARWFSKDIRQLGALTELCSQLETVVSEFDAAYEVKQEGKQVVKLDTVNNQVVICPTIDPIDSEDVKRLRDGYYSLYKAWGEWLKATGHTISSTLCASF